MREYITLAWYDPNTSDYLAKTIYESERKPIKTDLVNKDGTPLYRVDTFDPIGFVRHKDNP